MLLFPKRRRTIIVRITGEKKYSKDLGSFEDMDSKLPTLISKAMQEHQKAVKEEKEKQAKKEKQLKKQKKEQKKSDTRKQSVKI